MKIKTSVSISDRSRRLIEQLAAAWGESLSAAIERCIQIADLSHKKKRVKGNGKTTDKK